MTTIYLALLASAMLAVFFQPKSKPKMPAIGPPPPPGPSPDDEAALAELARKRKSLESKRVGRSNLVIPKSTSGLRIPE